MNRSRSTNGLITILVITPAHRPPHIPSHIISWPVKYKLLIPCLGRNNQSLLNRWGVWDNPYTSPSVDPKKKLFVIGVPELT